MREPVSIGWPTSVSQESTISIAPVVIRPRSIPFLSIASTALVGYFVVKSLVFGGGIAIFSMLLAVPVTLVGLWAFYRSRRSSVVIDGDQFIVHNGRQASSYNRADIAAVDLSGLEHHLTMDDGTGVRLPLEGSELVEAGILLSPPIRGHVHEY